MFTFQHLCRRFAALAFVLALLTPSTSQAQIAPQPQAEVIRFRNDTLNSVRVEVTSVFQGKPMRALPFVLNPNQLSNPGVSLPGDKIVILCDARMPTQILYKGVLLSSPRNQSYLIKKDPNSSKLTLVPVGGP